MTSKSLTVSKKNPALLPVQILGLTIMIIDIYIFYRLYQMKVNSEQCKCAVTPKTQNIMIVIGVLIFAGLISMVLLSIISYLLHVDKNKLVILPILIVLTVYCLQIYYAYLLITYSNDLVSTNCQCVSDTLKSNIHTYGWFRMILSTFPLAFTVLMMIMLILAIKSGTHKIIK
jgi:hypothetical protein